MNQRSDITTHNSFVHALMNIRMPIGWWYVYGTEVMGMRLMVWFASQVITRCNCAHTDARSGEVSCNW